jgi:DNA-directed RNA polymerase specialized sigma24 family protein
VFAAERRSARARFKAVVGEPGEPGEPSGPQRAAGDLYDRVEATPALSLLLGPLPPGQRRVIEPRRLAELGVRETGAALRCTESAVRSQE